MSQINDMYVHLRFLNWISYMVKHNSSLTLPLSHFLCFTKWFDFTQSQTFNCTRLNLQKIHSEIPDKVKYKEKMKVCSIVNPSTTEKIQIDFSGSRGVCDRCLCLNSFRDKWKTF